MRKYDATLNTCPTIDCADHSVASLGYEYLAANCVKADTSYEFEWAGNFETTANEYLYVAQAASAQGGAKANAEYEWAGAFATPENSYKWVAQATGLTPLTTAYADATMKLVVFSLDASTATTDAEKLLEKSGAVAPQGLESSVCVSSCLLFLLPALACSPLSSHELSSNHCRDRLRLCLRAPAPP